MREDYPSFTFDAPCTCQPLMLLLMSKVVKSHVKVEKLGKCKIKYKEMFQEISAIILLV
jgi:hypothetical protein